MTTYTDETFAQKKRYLDQAQVQMKKWSDGLERLDAELKKYPSEVQANYRREIGALRAQWEKVESAYERMDNADSIHWDKACHNWGKTAAAYWLAFSDTANRITDGHHVPLGWVQGLTDKRIYESAGWAEGFGRRPEGSEGWAEGSGKQTRGSEGWSEGYDRTSKE